MAEKVLSMIINSDEPPDFVMCIGDDRSDEDMFESILSTVSSPSLCTMPEIFACTVGRKPSKAKYYLDDVGDVVKVLKGLVNSSSFQTQSPSPESNELSKTRFEKAQFISWN